MKSRNKKNPLERPIARPGDPLVTGTGLSLMPERLHVNVEQTDQVVSTHTFKPKARRSVSELPAPVHIMNGIACIFAYTVLGLTEREIADALKITLGELKGIKAQAAYDEFFQSVSNEFINANSDLLHARIAAYSQSALTNVADIATNSKKDDTKLRANIDLLDRAGVGVSKGTTINIGDDDLKITVIKGDTKGVEVNLSQ